MTTWISPIPTPGMEQAFQRCVDCGAVTMVEMSAGEAAVLVIAGITLIVIALIVFVKKGE